MTELRAHGLVIELPGAWEGRIGLRPRSSGRTTTAPGARSGAVSRTAADPADPADPVDPLSGPTYPVSHVGNFPLPPDRGDFGSGAVDVMTDADVLMALVEYGPECVGTALFDRERPTPRIGEFSPNTLQRRIIGQLGYQQFFTEAGRAFCLYVVVGSVRYAPALLTETRTVLGAIRIEEGR